MLLKYEFKLFDDNSMYLQMYLQILGRPRQIPDWAGIGLDEIRALLKKKLGCIELNFQIFLTFFFDFFPNL